ncbi:MAG: lysylphosphatidylglycerol synthase domain-containing protein, partial [Calditrichia bacterium]
MKKGKILWGLKLLVGIILIAALYRQINQGQLVSEALRNANWFNILIAFLLMPLNVFIQFIKWRYLLRIRYREVESGPILKSLLFGFTLGFISPGNVGELARGLYFKKYDRLT